ncbi:MAG: hypothetical protein IJT12_04975 [Paludibacteraceae bacterium]|nr:hypothetical protein [Paludibacteraceae bacterium]
MPIKSEKYRCRTEQEAIAWIEREARQKMYPCVYPSRMGHDYYIGKDGKYAMPDTTLETRKS